jgi:hypothetical protein
MASYVPRALEPLRPDLLRSQEKLGRVPWHEKVTDGQLSERGIDINGEMIDDIHGHITI